MKAYIIAGGTGTRLAPFNEYRNKAALPIGNIPLCRRTADAALAAGADSVVIAGSYRMQEIKNIFLFDKNVSVLELPALQGSAASLWAMLKAVPPEGDFLVLFGDCLYCPEDIAALVASSRGEAAALVSAELDYADSSDWMCCRISDGMLRKFYGHPHGESPYRVAEAFVFSPSFLPYIECNCGVFRNVDVGHMPPLEGQLEMSVSDFIARGGLVTAVEGGEYFVDIDKPWHIMEACYLTVMRDTSALHENILAEGAYIDPSSEVKGFVKLGKNSFIGKNCRINGSITVGDNTRIDNGAIIDGPAVIGSNVRIENYCYISGGSTIGNGCVVLHAAEFEGVLFDGSYLYHYMEIEGLLGFKVDIGASCVCGTLRFDEGDSRHTVRGRRETPRNFANGTYIGDYSRTGVNCTFYPGVTIGCNCAVGPGVVVTEDIPSGTAVLLKQELVTKPWGPQKYGW